MSRNTNTGGVLEAMIFPALHKGGYCWTRHTKIGKRPGGGKHLVDAVVTKDALIILVSSKWQEVSGTAEQKVPFEVICLIRAIESGEYKRAYLVLGGPGWTLRHFYTSGGLTEYIPQAGLVNIVTLEQFVALANQSGL